MRASTAGAEHDESVRANQQGHPPPRVEATPSPALDTRAARAVQGETACARAQRCCVGFIGMMQQQYEVDGLDAHVCDGLGDIAHAGSESQAGCQAVIDGWRQSLEAMHGGIPPACR